jgi:hypothetical protein
LVCAQLLDRSQLQYFLHVLLLDSGVQATNYA